MDIVIPLTKDGSYWDDNELRYSLRSLQKNFKELGKVFIVGYKPRWVKNVAHIKFKDNYPENKGANIISKLLYACREKRISDDFLFLSDDQYFLVSMKSKDIKPYYCYDMSGLPLRKGNKFWSQCLRNTKKALLNKGLTCYNTEPHTPVIINKNKYREVMTKYDWKKTLYPTLSLYFNSILIPHEQLPPNYRIFYEGEEMAKNMNLINGKKFLCHTDLGLSYQLQSKLRELFPRKSKFEK